MSEDEAKEKANRARVLMAKGIKSQMTVSGLITEDI